MWEFLSIIAKLFSETKARSIKVGLVLYFITTFTGTGLLSFIPDLTIFQCVTVSLFTSLMAGVTFTTFYAAIFGYNVKEHHDSNGILLCSIFATIAGTLLGAYFYLWCYHTEAPESIIGFTLEMCFCYGIVALSSFFISMAYLYIKRGIERSKVKKAAQQEKK